MKKILILLLFFITIFSWAQTVQKKTVTLMGSKFDLTIVAQDKQTALAYIDSCVMEISRIEHLISDWIPTSQVSEINRNAGVKPTKVDQELLDLTERAIAFSQLSNGAFDISFAAADKIWKFDGSMTKLPSETEILESIKKIGYQKIVINREESTIFLKEEGMKMGFGATGKGYAADKAKELMVSKGVSAGIINASGDMSLWGKQPDGSNWIIGVTNPFKKEKLFKIYQLTDGAVVTSGNYEKYVLIDGKRYAHIIDPRTGYPASGIVSVTIFANSAEFANGISTSIMVLGKEKGLKLLNETPNVQGFFIDDKGKVYYSKKFKIRRY